MDKKACFLRLACVLTCLEVAVMVASLVTGSVLPQGGTTGAGVAISLFDRVSGWLMLGHNFLEVCVYGILAWLLASNNRSYAITGFVSSVVGLVALSASILIEAEVLPSPYYQLHFREPFGIGYGTIDWLLGLVGAFCILPANGFFALATLRHSQSRPAVPAILFMGIPIGLINLFIPDQATAWLAFLGNWLVPTFVLAKQVILLWWFTTLLHPIVAPKKSVLPETLLADLPGFRRSAAPDALKLEPSVATTKSR